MLRQFVLSLAFLATATSFGQTILLPAKIVFNGDSSLSQTELLAFTGLKPGGSCTQQELQQATQNLADTGLFADIRYGSTPAGLIFTLKPMDAEFVLPARFSNFPWWSRNELLETLQAKVPLFHGMVPVKGNLQDKLTAALVALVTEKGVANAQVLAMPNDTPGQAPSISFAISSPDVVVRSVTLAQGDPKMALPLENLGGKPYDETQTPRSIGDTLTEAYRNLGYLDAAVTGTERGAPQVTAQAVNVDYKASVSEGDLYHLTSISWPGSPVLSTADFAKRATIHAGDVASVISIRGTLRVIAVAYYRKGFQDAKISAPETRDKVNHTVSYVASVVPGEQYRIHAIKTSGLSAEQQRDFDANWKMVAGEFYDVDYSNQFLLAKNLPKSLLGFSGKWRAVSDPNTHLVDLSIAFSKGGTLVEVR